MSQSPHCKGLRAACVSGGFLRCRGWWLWCGVVTSQCFAPERTGAATPLARRASPVLYNELHNVGSRQAIDLACCFSVWRGRYGWILTPPCYSWGNNASHSPSGAPGGRGYFGKYKRNRVDSGKELQSSHGKQSHALLVDFSWGPSWDIWMVAALGIWVYILVRCADSQSIIRLASEGLKMLNFAHDLNVWWISYSTASPSQVRAKSCFSSLQHDKIKGI